MMNCFTPEDFTADHRRIADAVRAFVRDEVHPRADEIDSGNFAVVRSLLRRAGEIGLLAPDIPLVSQAIVAENVGPEGSFSVAVIGHGGIGTLPIYMYGSDDLRARYMPRMARGEFVGAFALTEKNTGSDALSVETVAAPQADGSFILNGEKIYCSNGNIADIFIAFAKVEDRGLAAFLVEKGADGLAVGDAPRKMGLGGSAAVPLTFLNVRVPAENAIGEIGNGHKVALGVLNIARFKLGATCVGNSKSLIREMVGVATSRRRFGRPLSDFELVRQKIARAAARTYMHESLVYRIAGEMDRELSSSNLVSISEKFAMECAIAKVYGSETIAFVSDEAVQLLGGEGYVRGSEAERAYRDFRVDRIFEGTNEINRLFIASQAIKMAMSDKFDVIASPALRDEAISGNQFVHGIASPPAADRNDIHLMDQIDNLKSIASKVAMAAVKALGDTLKRRQAVLANISDMLIEICALESGCARAIATGDLHFRRMCEVWIAERTPALHNAARQTMVNICGDADRLGIYEPLAVDTDSLYGEIAAATLHGESWPRNTSRSPAI